MQQYQSEVVDWMRPVQSTVSSSDSLVVAYDMMQEEEVRRLPVVDIDDVVGIITLSDILRQMPLVADDGDRETRLMMNTKKVREVMTYDPVTIQSEDTIQDAAERMLEYQVSGLPVLDGGRLVGIITEKDIFRVVIEMLSAQLDQDN